jgi:hypothetical protein
MRGIAAAVLVFEGLVILFATLVAVDLGDVDDSTLWWVGGSAAVACVVAAGLVRRPWGHWVGSALQVVVVAAGVVLAVPAMLFLGIVFAGLWFLTLHLGLKLERARAAYERGRPPDADTSG